MSERADPMDKYRNVPRPPTFASVADERLHRKQRLAAAFRVFARCGFDEGVAGHITARDPGEPETFWVNPFGVSYAQVRVSNLIRVDEQGNVIDGNHIVNAAAFAIHSRIHKARPDVMAAAHAHSLYGKTWSSLGRTLDPITQDACAFFNDHSVYSEFSGVVVDVDEGDRIASALGKHKAVIVQNHGLLTAGKSVDEAAWWFVSMERCCQSQLLAEAAGTPKLISNDIAAHTYRVMGSTEAGWFNFQPLYARVLQESPDFLE